MSFRASPSQLPGCVRAVCVQSAEMMNFINFCFALYPSYRSSASNPASIVQFLLLEPWNVEYRSNFNVYFYDNIRECDLWTVCLYARMLIHQEANLRKPSFRFSHRKLLRTHSACVTAAGNLNANQLRDSITCHSLLPQVCFLAVYRRSVCKMLNL